MAKDPANVSAPACLPIEHSDIQRLPFIAASTASRSRCVLGLAAAIILLCGLAIATYAQTAQTTASPQPTPEKPPDLTTEKDFRPLFAERAALIDELRDLDQAVDDLQTKLRALRSVDTLEQDLKKAKSVLDTLKRQASTPPTESQQKDIDTQGRYVDQINDNLQIARNSKPILDANKSEQAKKRQRLFAIEQRIAALFDATRDQNQFRLSATISFSVLVFIVVGGFYLIAWYKEGVAKTIFAGELGMQFVTLFLVVIAIILFGIMGTLEGKELSALLGGLSGYILGRAGSSKRSETPPPNPNQNETQLPGTQTGAT